MNGRTRASRILAVVGTVLVGLPLAAPLLLAAVPFVTSGRVLLDFLMPGELFPLVVLGGAALLVGALLLRRRRLLVVLPLAAAILLFVATNLFAMATGLATGSSPTEGWRLVGLVAIYAGYVAAVVALLVGGILLCRTAFSSASRVGSPPDGARPSA